MHNEKKNKNKKRMNAEHGEENVQVKPHAYVHRRVDRMFGFLTKFLLGICSLRPSIKKVKFLMEFYSFIGS